MDEIPENPTWQQLQSGLSAVGREKRQALNRVRAANLALQEEKRKVELASRDVNTADAKLEQWLRAVKLKVDSAT